MRGLELLEVAWRRRTTASSGSRPRTWPTSPPPGSSWRPRSPPPAWPAPSSPATACASRWKTPPSIPGPPPGASSTPACSGPPCAADLRRLLVQAPDCGGRPAGPARGPGVHALRPPGGPVLFRPAAILEQGEQVGAVDHEGEHWPWRAPPAGWTPPSCPPPAWPPPAWPSRCARAPPGTGLLCSSAWPRAGCACAAWPLFSLPRTAHRAAHRAHQRRAPTTRPTPTDAGAGRKSPGCAPPRSTWSASSPPAGAAPGPSSWRWRKTPPWPRRGPGDRSAPPARGGRHRRPRPSAGPDGASRRSPGPWPPAGSCGSLPGWRPSGTWTPPTPAPHPSAPAPRACSPGPPGPGGRRGLGLRPDARSGWPAEWILVDLPPTPRPHRPHRPPPPPSIRRAAGEVLDGHPVAGPLSPRRRRSRALRPAQASVPGAGCPVPDQPGGLPPAPLPQRPQGRGAIGSGGDLRFKAWTTPRRTPTAGWTGPPATSSPPPRMARPGPWSGAGARRARRSPPGHPRPGPAAAAGPDAPRPRSPHHAPLARLTPPLPGPA